ncbi:origin recognition complex subunit 2 domain-containing protein [Hirsutella rhossiliensis]|uniref:Origin recognition complex subunit 2 n=1 Tax=Hirsutella rhossiliensis TaxID=111463 RepID=A0A9P8N1M5_9HYPO|nr:origin recognition complex subunit 2 domain-containing protein [Hirsutella rhossiliensis]KAH0965220.1 origin recognition complex subunit 2 domain-containing protein [Hirsutella rhossiliensis]
MPRRKAAQADSPHDHELRSSNKRAHDPDAADLTSTPAKRRRASASQEARSVEKEPTAGTEETLPAVDEVVQFNPETEASAQDQDESEPPIVTPRKRGRPPKASSTPRSKANATSTFATPSKVVVGSQVPTPRRLAADRSARKKSARALIENVVRNGAGDDEADDDGGDTLVREIYEDSDDNDDDDKSGEGLDSVAATPSKTPRQGRPKKAKSPTPPRDLPPHELYFVHNKPGRPKTSHNTLGSLALLTHEEYFNILHEHQDRHSADVEYLEALHAESFPQWTFELLQGFSLCLYGFGSKRALLRKFARHLHSRDPGDFLRKTVIVNGYSHSANMREILGCIGAAIDPKQRIPTSTPPAMVHSIMTLLSSVDLVLTVIINSIDAAPLRKPGMQAILAQLAAHPQVNLVCSTDTPDFPLLWDVGVRSAFNFAFHDCTTFAPLTVELDVVDEVHELLGRKARRVNGRDGVAFVLRSLPENAKNLFRLLVSEVLIALDEEGGAAGDESAGVEYRMVYNKAVEEFICTSEMAFRTLLKEFHDHQIITSRKDAIGTELLSVPFSKEELEAMLEDLMA